ncbi:ATP-dependent DNA helicase RecG [Lactobacillus iners LactinV 03V1-b]|nr:ATP-dependent DNA helicase RecG [Lactobacillus iners LactinV 03V1-b]
MEIVNLKVLLNPVSDLDGVGVKTAEALSQLKIKTIYDLLFYFPRRYDSLEIFPLNELKDGQKVLLKGKIVTDVVVSRYGYHNTRLNFKMQIDHDIIMVNFFNQPWLKKQLQKGNDIAIYGKLCVS